MIKIRVKPIEGETKWQNCRLGQTFIDECEDWARLQAMFSEVYKYTIEVGEFDSFGTLIQLAEISAGRIKRF